MFLFLSTGTMLMLELHVRRIRLWCAPCHWLTFMERVRYEQEGNEVPSGSSNDSQRFVHAFLRTNLRLVCRMNTKACARFDMSIIMHVHTDGFFRLILKGDKTLQRRVERLNQIRVFHRT